MIKRNLRIACSLLFVASSLVGCSNVRGSLGLEKESPDEFSVMTRAPLEMPSQLTLPPPNPGMPRPQEKSTIKQAKEAVFGENTQTLSEESSAEHNLLEKAGSDNVEPNIRATVNNESAVLENRNKPVVEKLLNMTGTKNKTSATIVDAKKEHERIKKNIEDGKNVTDGETPSIED